MVPGNPTTAIVLTVVAAFVAFFGICVLVYYLNKRKAVARKNRKRSRASTRSRRGRPADQDGVELQRSRSAPARSHTR